MRNLISKLVAITMLTSMTIGVIAITLSGFVFGMACLAGEALSATVTFTGDSVAYWEKFSQLGCLEQLFYQLHQMCPTVSSIIAMLLVLAFTVMLLAEGVWVWTVITGNIQRWRRRHRHC